MSNNDKNGSKFPITDIEAFWIIILTTLQTALYIAWRLANGIEFNEICLNSGSVVPLFTLIATFIVQMREAVMFLRNKLIAQRKKLRDEGRAEGMAKRDAEWMEWAENGKDPDKMPSKINPVNTKTDKVDTKKS